MLKILQARFQQYVNCELQMFMLVLQRAEKPNFKLPTSTGSLKKQESSRETSICALLSNTVYCLCVEGFVCALQVSVSPVLCKFWGLYGGVNGNLLQEGLCHLQVIAPRSPAPAASHCCPQETLKHTKAGLTQSLWLSLDVCPLFSIKLQGKNFLHLHITF